MHNLELNIQSDANFQPYEKSHEQYSSVEISSDTTRFCYHFKLWRIDQNGICILVKEDSQILPGLKEGNRMNMKYYGPKPVTDIESRETIIKLIRKADNGRFKGHYLVYLSILN